VRCMCHTKDMRNTDTKGNEMTVYIWRSDAGAIHGVFADKETAVSAIIDPATEFVTAHTVKAV
jgi:hypothetical protein